MNGNNSFEERLRRQPLKNVPDSWRSDILACARSAAREDSLVRTRAVKTEEKTAIALLQQILIRIISELACPSRKAWAALGATWAVIIAVSLANRETDETMFATSNPRRSQLAEELLKQQAQLFAEFSGAVEAPDAVPPKRQKSGPRSERQYRFSAV